MKPGTPLYRLLIDRYPALKSQWPADGRRKLLLRLGEEFWRCDSSEMSMDGDANSAESLTAELFHDADPYDQLTDGPEPGILVRADYSNEDAWQAFYALLQEGEQELAEATEEQKTVAEEALGDGSSSASQSQGVHAQADEDVEMVEDNEEEDDDDDDDPPRVFKVVNPSPQQDRAIFNQISNLAALRLLNDMDIRRAPSPPPGTKRISPPNRLIDQRGWQEIYTGKSVWIYDSQSNVDQSVRVVSQEGANLYGTATGDSWRARVTHICELQLNIWAGMKIDFGERDGWDYSERRRNLAEATVPIL